jgi:hypothetical protein
MDGSFRSGLIMVGNTMKTPKTLLQVARIASAIFAAACGTISFWLKQHDTDFGQQTAAGNKTDGQH